MLPPIESGRGRGLNPPENPVKELVVGEVFRPFEGLTELVPPGIGMLEEPIDPSQSLYQVPFTFQAVRGYIDLEVWAPHFGSVPITPMGEARLVVSLSNGKQTLVEAPVNPTVTIPSVNSDQYRMLRNFRLEFLLGDERSYWLDLSGWDKEEDVLSDFQRMDQVEVFDGDLNFEGQTLDQEVKLPFDLEKIRGIQARVVELPH